MKLLTFLLKRLLITRSVTKLLLTFPPEPSKAKSAIRVWSTQEGEQRFDNHTDKLLSQSIVISGVFARHSRDEYKELIEKHGGKNVGSISRKTSFILAGENMGPSKLEKAEKLGIRIVNEEEFLGMIGE